MAAEAEPELVHRSLSLDLIPPDAQRQAILVSIRRYRSCCRQLFAVLGIGQASGATLEIDGEKGPRLQPQSDQSKIALATALGAVTIEQKSKTKGKGQAYSIRVGSGFGYELRDYFRKHLYPEALSFVFDSVRRDIITAWTSKDPEFPQASRGYLALQGARGLGEFARRGIGFPPATARPRLEKHQLVLKWDHDIGSVAFKVPRLDGGRYRVWKRLCEGLEGWNLGTIYLSERDGRCFATISYSMPPAQSLVDPKRVCAVKVHDSGDHLFTIRGAEDRFAFELIEVHEVVAWLHRMQTRRLELEQRRAACGNPRRPWGHRHGWLATQDVLSRLTEQRVRGVKDRNHAWTRRIVGRAASWHCGTIKIGVLPRDLRGHPWAWSQFEEFLRYKGKERGISVDFESAASA